MDIFKVIGNSWHKLGNFLDNKQKTVWEFTIVNLVGFIASILVNWWLQLKDKSLVEKGATILSGEPAEVKPTEQKDFSDPATFEVKPLARWNLNKDLADGEINDNVNSEQSYPQRESVQKIIEDGKQFEDREIYSNSQREVRQQIIKSSNTDGKEIREDKETKVSDLNNYRNADGITDITQQASKLENNIFFKKSKIETPDTDRKVNVSDHKNCTSADSTKDVRLQDGKLTNNNSCKDLMFETLRHNRDKEVDVSDQKNFQDASSSLDMDINLAPKTFNFNEALLNGEIPGAEYYIRGNKILFK